MTISEYLTKLRRESNISQIDISKKSKIEQSRLSRIERGEIEPNIDEIKSYLEALDSKEADEVLSFLNRPFRYFPKPKVNHPQRNLLTKVDAFLKDIKDFLTKDNIPPLFQTQLTTYQSQIINLAEFVLRLEHNITFVGDIGCGKTTAICKLLDLILSKSDKKDIPSKRTVLATASGRTTLCEVILSSADNFGISIETYSEGEINLLVEEFCRQLFDEDSDSNIKSAENSGRLITEEIERVVRNMSDLSKKTEKLEDGSYNVSDPAKELCEEYKDIAELRQIILSRMKLKDRTDTKLWANEDSYESNLEWLQRSFNEINSGRAIKFSIPKTINVFLPKKILLDDYIDLNIIDSKGIDETSIRPDIKRYLENQRTLIVFCTKFNDAPSVSIQELIKHRRDLGDEATLEDRSMLLILPQNDEAKQTKLPDGSTNVESDIEGYEIKRSQVINSLKGLKIKINPIVVFNSISDESEMVSKEILNKLLKYRSKQIEKIENLMVWGKELIDKFSEEQVLKTQEKVIKRVKKWCQENSKIELKEKYIHELLLNRIHLAHAQTVRATNYRTGYWDNLNYYQLIGEGSAMTTLSHFNKNLLEIKGILAGLLKDDDYLYANNFIKSLMFELDGKIKLFLSEVENSAQNTFSFPLQTDNELWRNCIARWGKGPNYRDEIKKWIKDWFENNLNENLHNLVNQAVQRHWETHIIKMFEKYFD